MKKILISLIKIYQRILSPDQGLLRYFYVNNRQHCAMHPTCSSYMILAIEKYGPLRGFLKGIWRIFRCNPFQKNFIDFP